MRKSIPPCVIAIAIALLACSLALPAERNPERGASDEGSRLRAAQTAAATPTVHNLLRLRMEWARQLSRALRALEQGPLPQPMYGIQTIIDDPDPVGLKKEGEPPPPSEEDTEDGSGSRDEDEGNLNPGAIQVSEFG